MGLCLLLFHGLSIGSGWGSGGGAQAVRGQAREPARVRARAQRVPNLFIVHFGTREGACEERRGFAGD